MEGRYFIFDGIKSSDMDLNIVRIGSGGGFVESPYWGSANIREKQATGKISPYFYGVDRKPIEFTIQLTLIDSRGESQKWTPQKRFEIAEWLLQEQYKKFQTSDDLGKSYYAIVSSQTDLNLMSNEGYIEVTFKTNSPYAWSPVYVDSFDLSSNTTSEVIKLENRSNVVELYSPLIEVQLVGDTTEFELKNLSNSGRSMRFDNLVKGETIGIDCENRIIKSNALGSNPFSNFNKGERRYWMDLVKGANYIEVTGAIKIYVKSVFPIAQ